MWGMHHVVCAAHTSDHTKFHRALEFSQTKYKDEKSSRVLEISIYA